MDADEFRKRGKEMVDYIADYMETIRDRRPLADVQPGYLKKLIPEQAPEEPEPWTEVFKDIERVVMPGVTHWNNPNFHAYYPSGNSYASICADMLSDAISCVCFSWLSSPAGTELDVAMMDWLGKMLQLPTEFLSGGKGGGVIQGSASEATLVALLAARSRIIKRLQASEPDTEEAYIMSKLVVYCSDESHTSVERACLMGAVKCHVIQADSKGCMGGDALQKAIQHDKANGLLPFLCVATLGTTYTCSFDNLMEIGPVCQEDKVWLHIDAAYAGSAFICPEFRPLLNGVEMADSFNFNPHKWLLVNYDCSAMWFQDASHFVDAYKVDSVIFQHSQNGQAPDLRHWQIPLGSRFRSLKLWFVLRLYGVKALQAHIRKQVSLAKEFERLVKSDERFSVTYEVKMGLVCFRLNGSNDRNSVLLKRINDDGRIHMVPGSSRDIFYLRFAVCSSQTGHSDIVFAWNVIQEIATKLTDGWNTRQK